MNTTRRKALALLGGGGVATGLSPVTAWAAPRHQYDLVPEKVAHDIWMIRGETEYFTDENGGAIVNCALLNGPNGVVIVDTGTSRRYGEALRNVAHQINGLGVAAVVNTHHHPDHFFGNQVFADRPIHALAETRALAGLEGDGFADNLYRMLGDWMRGTEPLPPTHVLEAGPVSLGGRTFEVMPLAGHTSADLALMDTATGTLIAGDLAFLDRAPTTPHADLAEWRKSLDSLAAAGAAAILPGHGPLDQTGASLIQTRAYLDWLEATLQDAARHGLDMVEIMATPLPEGFAAMGAQPQEFHRSIAHLYPGIERSILPLND